MILEQLKNEYSFLSDTYLTLNKHLRVADVQNTDAPNTYYSIQIEDRITHTPLRAWHFQNTPAGLQFAQDTYTKKHALWQNRGRFEAVCPYLETFHKPNPRSIRSRFGYVAHALASVIAEPLHFQSVAPGAQNLNTHIADIQADFFYTFENNSIALRDANQALKRKGCKALAQQVCADFGIKPPSILFPTFKNKRIDGQSDASLNTITIQTKDMHTVLHELAHYILGKKAPALIGLGHGPAFSTFALQLYSEYMDIDAELLMEEATSLDIGKAHKLYLAIAPPEAPQDIEEIDIRSATDLYQLYLRAKNAGELDNPEEGDVIGFLKHGILPHISLMFKGLNATNFAQITEILNLEGPPSNIGGLFGPHPLTAEEILSMRFEGVHDDFTPENTHDLYR